MIRLLLVDDQPIVRQGLCMRLMLEPDITVVGEASSGEQALVLVESLAPDIVLMDVEMPAMGGISQLIRLIICVRHQQQRLLVFGLSEHNRYILEITRLSQFIDIAGTETQAVAAVHAT